MTVTFVVSGNAFEVCYVFLGYRIVVVSPRVLI